MSVTLKDIAFKCNVDISTVSRALRDDPRVQKSTITKVKKIARILGYQPNLAARSLAAGKTQTIWFIVPTLDNPLEREPAKHASNFLVDKGYDTLIASHYHNIKIGKRLLNRLAQKVTDGAIIIPGGESTNANMYKPLVKSKYPIIFFDRHIEGIGASGIVTDNKAGVDTILEMCLKENISGVINLFHASNSAETARKESLSESLKELNIKEYQHADTDLLEPQNLPERIALICSSQQLARKFMANNNWLQENHSLIIGTFDGWDGAPYPAEKVIVGYQDFETMAVEAVKMLLDMINNGYPDKPVVKTVKPHKYEVIK